MSSKNNKKTERVVAADQAAIMSIFRTIGDVTWRMFTPPAIFVSAGIWADLKFQTKPWITIAFTLVGLSLSVLLVRQQLRGIR